MKFMIKPSTIHKLSTGKIMKIMIKGAKTAKLIMKIMINGPTMVVVVV